MSEYLFGLGSGYLPKRAQKIAKKHGATLINYCDPGCSCGYNCLTFNNDCPANQRHWFAAENRGEPWNSAMALALEIDLKIAKIKSK